MADIEHLIRIAAPPEDVFPLVSCADGFKGWWAEDVVDQGNGVVCLGFFDRATVYTLTLEGPASVSRVAWKCETGAEWVNTRLLFVLSQANHGTVLKFSHVDWRAATEYFRLCNTTWGELMYRLKAAAEGHTRGPLFLRNAQAY